MPRRPAAHPEPEIPLDLERLVFFSDAVFAIAITLLVIELAVPDSLPTDEALREALGELLPSLFSFVLSFAVIGLWWINHHRLMRVVNHSHGGLVGLNFVLLAAIAFLPFASGVLGHHGDLPTAVILYAGTNIVAATALIAMRLVAERAHLLYADVNAVAYERRTRYLVVTAAIFVVSIPVALWSPSAASAMWNLIFVQVAYRAWDERRRRRAHEGMAEA